MFNIKESFVKKSEGEEKRKIEKKHKIIVVASILERREFSCSYANVGIFLSLLLTSEFTGTTSSSSDGPPADTIA